VNEGSRQSAWSVLIKQGEEGVMPNIADAEHVESRGYLLRADDGERLTNPSGEIIFKVDPSRGSDNLSLGTQQVPPGAGIPRHRHTYMDEFIYILEGSGTVLLNDERLPIWRGNLDRKPYCLTGECSRDVKRCLTKRAPVASLILWLRRSSFSDF
jgi:quercetin dioxygenase-like cupin family protein